MSKDLPRVRSALPTAVAAAALLGTAWAGLTSVLDARYASASDVAHDRIAQGEIAARVDALRSDVATIGNEMSATRAEVHDLAVKVGTVAGAIDALRPTGLDAHHPHR